MSRQKQNCVVLMQMKRVTIVHRLYDGETNTVVATYEVQRILFFARGPVKTANQACFAFTWSHGESQETATHQCHVFRCNIPEAVTQVSG